MNLNTQIEKVTVRNGEVWHRVLVGPFQNRSKLAQARSTLVSNDINPLLLKRKAG
jgi:cell division protein FtsN